MRSGLIIFLLSTCVFAAETLDIRILRVEFKYEDKDNSLTTGRGVFEENRESEEYWQNHIEFANNYFSVASGGEVSIRAEVYPKNEKAYKLSKQMIEYNRTARRKGEKLEAFDSARTVDYARFVNDVLELAKADPDNPLAYSPNRAILIAHAGHSRLVDGGTMGIRGANTPGDFIDAYVDTSWGEFWRGFEASENDTINSVMVTSETASQDGLEWGVNGTITLQIGRELGLPYSYDVVKGFSRLGYFDGMDFAGANAGNGFFPSLPNAWMRASMGWHGSAVEVSPPINGKAEVEICAAAHSECGAAPQIVKIPINSNEYILLENRQRRIDIPVDSLQYHTETVKGASAADAAIPAGGIAAWRVNKWYIDELARQGAGWALNAWNGDTLRDHQFGIALIEADGVLGLGKEFRTASGESAFYFGSGSDLIPHKKKLKSDTVFSINPSGYANTASTFGGYSGIKITAKIPEGAKEERTLNMLTGDSVITWRALKIPVEIERVGEFAIPIPKNKWPSYEPNFEKSRMPDFTRIPLGSDSIYLGNNRLYIVDSNNVPLPNFPVVLSNGEPFSSFHSKPLSIDLTGNDSLYILIPANNGLILAVNGSSGKLLKGEFPLSAGTFEYNNPDTLLLDIYGQYLFAKHREDTTAFYLLKAKEYVPKSSEQEKRDEISEFFIFPNPVRGGRASIRFRILNDASAATLDIFDITGRKSFSQNFSNIKLTNQEPLDLSKLGSDVYSARLTVKFASGAKKEKWIRIGVIR
jgi:hypothetical protein